MKLLKGILFSGLILFLMVSCNDIKDCQLKKDTNQMVIRFFDRDTTSTAESVGFREIGIKDSDILLLSRAEADTLISAFSVPLNTSDSTTTFYFQTELGADTLVLKYSWQYFIFFEECDPSQQFIDLEVVSHTFDSIGVVSSIINVDIDSNVEIYLD